MAAAPPMALDLGDKAKLREAEVQQKEGGESSNQTAEKGKGELSAQEKNRRFWAAKAEWNRNRESGIPINFEPQELNADKVKLPLEEWSPATGKYENALVGYVFGANPPLGKIRAFARSRWGGAEAIEVSLLNDGIFLLSFETERKKMEVLTGGPWTFDNRPLIVKEWRVDEEYICGSIPSLPVWVRLPNIKAHLTNPKLLGRLCSNLGRPICTDGITAAGTSFKFARVCIEVYAENEFRDEIVYEDPFGNTYKQRVIYEWRPPRCTNCLNYGHRSENCPEENFEKLVCDLKRSEEEERRRKMNEILCEEEDMQEEENSNFKENETHGEEEEVLEVDNSNLSLKEYETLGEEEDGQEGDRTKLKGNEKAKKSVLKEKNRKTNDRTESGKATKQSKKKDHESTSRVEETQKSEDSTRDEETIESQSEELPIAEHFKDYISKSAAKRARQKEKKRLAEQMENEREKKKENIKGVNEKGQKEIKSKKKEREKTSKDGDKTKSKF